MLISTRLFMLLTDSALLAHPSPISFICAISNRYCLKRTQSLHLPRHPPASPRVRQSSSASSTRWKTRQANDHFAREARVSGLKSRAAFKLLQIDERYKILKRGSTIVDLVWFPFKLRDANKVLPSFTYSRLRVTHLARGPK